MKSEDFKRRAFQLLVNEAEAHVLAAVKWGQTHNGDIPQVRRHIERLTQALNEYDAACSMLREIEDETSHGATEAA